MPRRTAWVGSHACPFRALVGDGTRLLGCAVAVRAGAWGGAGRSVWEARERHVGGITAVAAGPGAGGAALVASGARDGTVRLWSAARGTLLQTFQTALYSRGALPARWAVLSPPVCPSTCAQIIMHLRTAGIHTLHE